MMKQEVDGVLDGATTLIKNCCERIERRMAEAQYLSSKIAIGCDKQVRVIQVIETNLTIRGNGKDEPFYRVTQYWSMDGELLAEKEHR